MGKVKAMCVKDGVSLHSQKKVRFGGYLEWANGLKIWKKSTIRKMVKNLIWDINDSKKLLTN